MEEYTRTNGKEARWTDPKAYVLPGQEISKIPRIINCGNNCYVRADINFVDTMIDETSLYGMSDQWILAPDGYYYYKEILVTGDSVDLFHGFKVPIDLQEEAQDCVQTDQ